MSFYLDASVIVPTLIRETSSEAVDEWLFAATEDLNVGEFAAAGPASALGRLVRNGGARGDEQILGREPASKRREFLSASRAMGSLP